MILNYRHHPIKIIICNTLNLWAFTTHHILAHDNDMVQILANILKRHLITPIHIKDSFINIHNFKIKTLE